MQIHQLETNNYYSDAQILDQFIAGLKDKLIKKVCPHVPEDLNSVIQHAKRYEMAMEEANCTKFVNLAIGETSSAAEEKIDQLTKKNCHYCGISDHWKRDCKKLQQDQQNKSNQHYSPPQQSYYQPPPPAYYPPYPNTKITIISPLHSQFNSNTNNHPHNIINYLTILKEQDFHHTAPSEGRATAQQQNPSYTPITIPPARITENANLSDIFPFKFETNESSFLLSNAATNKQKAITAMYTEAEVKEKTICLILDSGSAGSIITYQLMQQLKKNVD
ncbi:hypothetical protein G9A89_019451 [Geosiphon pyriformis]|nr:hypothetical protein G9A89_019451 [Geosiphon pyriformis]